MENLSTSFIIPLWNIFAKSKPTYFYEVVHFSTKDTITGEKSKIGSLTGTSIRTKDIQLILPQFLHDSVSPK